MTDTLFSIVAQYGVAAIAISAFLSCLLVPIPTAFLMLAGGGFAAAGDLNFGAVVAAAYLAAVLGDQTGFQIGRMAGPRLDAFAGESGPRRAILDRARDTVDQHGGKGVFFSTWLFAPLGPWVNLTAGAAGMSRWRFTLCDAAGEAIWVTFYATMGYLFASQIDALSTVLSNAAGALASAAVAVGIGAILWRRRRRKTHPGDA
ncbi:MAG: VTT domain-containing protein [Pseudomonadota bacterium]